MDLENKRVLVVGLGKSGVAAAKFLRRRGAKVIANDLRERSALGELASELEELNVELALGEHDPVLFSTVDQIVVSPGVPPLPALDAAERAGVPIVGEIELASRYIDAPIVGVTGTNGKSTVTSLIGAILEQTERPHFVGGNLGTPLLDAIGAPGATAEGCVVVELSSFQLERVDRFHAFVAVLLNVTDDHLDRYSSFDDYAAAKRRIFETQRPGEHAIVPAGDAFCEALAAAGPGTLHRFGGGEGEVRVVDGAIEDAISGLRIELGDLKLVGAHNHENICAAALAARLIDVPPEAIEAGIVGFAGLPHRMEFVCEVGGVRFYDDSKATNVGASVAAIDGLEASTRVVLIAGGKDKGGSYEPLRERMLSRGRALVLIGEAADRIAESFSATSLPLVFAESLEAAVKEARSMAQPGDVVLLAPACASFDMFTSYVARGQAFQRAARALQEVG